MKVIYEPISVFRKKYKVIASFYTNKRGIESRLFADIVDRDSIESDIDAYIIMINPGSCKVKPGEADESIKNSIFYSEYDGVVEAISDLAQKCVMSFMATCNLKKVRILNLSDIKDGNLENAMTLMGADKKVRRAESIFSPERAADRAKVMPNDSVCIAAWGVDNSLKDLKKQAYDCIGAERIIGISTDEKNYSYRYIKPRGTEAQIKVISELSEKYKNFG